MTNETFARIRAQIDDAKTREELVAIRLPENDDDRRMYELSDALTRKLGLLEERGKLR